MFKQLLFHVLTHFLLGLSCCKISEKLNENYEIIMIKIIMKYEWWTLSIENPIESIIISIMIIKTGITF